jgi:two-component system nitrogen regulation sensor histidine kinase GlnL
VQDKILDHLNESILLFDNHLILQYINTAGEELFADSSHHLVGLTAQDLFKLSDPTFLQDIKLCFSSNEPLVDRGLIFDQSEKNITLNLSATPLLKEQHHITSILVELSQVDWHLKISKEEQLLAQHNAARMLVRGLAHEIKNPLGGIRGAAQLLDAELTDPELKEYTHIIIAESDRLQGLMDKMLGPKMLPNKTQLNIHEVLERVRQLTNAETSDRISIIRDFDPSIPFINADKNQLIQATLNIVRNGIQALQHQGEIILRTRIQRQMTIHRKLYKLTIRIDIVDTGPGIPTNLIEQIFYPMITGRAEGTGLGLSIAQSLINLHNGIIECKSEPGNTVFSIFLPLENDHGE